MSIEATPRSEYLRLDVSNADVSQSETQDFMHRVDTLDVLSTIWTNRVSTSSLDLTLKAASLQIKGWAQATPNQNEYGSYKANQFRLLSYFGGTDATTTLEPMINAMLACKSYKINLNLQKNPRIPAHRREALLAGVDNDVKRLRDVIEDTRLRLQQSPLPDFVRRADAIEAAIAGLVMDTELGKSSGARGESHELAMQMWANQTFPDCIVVVNAFIIKPKLGNKVKGELDAVLLKRFTKDEELSQPPVSLSPSSTATVSPQPTKTPTTTPQTTTSPPPTTTSATPPRTTTTTPKPTTSATLSPPPPTTPLTTTLPQTTTATSPPPTTTTTTTTTTTSSNGSLWLICGIIEAKASSLHLDEDLKRIDGLTTALADVKDDSGFTFTTEKSEKRRNQTNVFVCNSPDYSNIPVHYFVGASPSTNEDEKSQITATLTTTTTPPPTTNANNNNNTNNTTNNITSSSTTTTSSSSSSSTTNTPPMSDNNNNTTTNTTTNDNNNSSNNTTTTTTTNDDDNNTTTTTNNNNDNNCNNNAPVVLVDSVADIELFALFDATLFTRLRLRTLVEIFKPDSVISSEWIRQNVQLTNDHDNKTSTSSATSTLVLSDVSSRYKTYFQVTIPSSVQSEHTLYCRNRLGDVKARVQRGVLTYWVHNQLRQR